MALAPLSRLKSRERRMVLFAGVCLVLYLVGYLWAIPTWRRWQEGGPALEEKQAMLLRTRETISREPEMRRRLAALEETAKGYDRFMLSADKAPVAAAELQDLVKEAAGKGLDIVSEKIGKPVDADRFTVVPVEITANGGMNALRDFLWTVETGSPVLTVPEITIRTNKRRTFDTVTKKYLDVEELQATVLINGMMRGGR